jgi:excisionase family DNA binding protein
VPGTEHNTLKMREVAADLRIGKNQAYELVRDGRIRSVRIGRAIRVTREALDEFKAGQEAAARAR